MRPREARVVRVEVGDPAPSSAHLTTQALRQRFAWFRERPELAQLVPGSGLDADGATDVVIPLADALDTNEGWRDAAVLIGLIPSGQGLEVLLTVRTQHLKHHPGQISFPGGRCESSDTDAVATALREAREEVGIHPAEVDVLGLLPRYRTVTRYHVTPVVALCTGYGPIDKQEVESVFQVPLAYLMNPAYHELREYQWGTSTRRFYAIAWQEHLIWGATAAMLRSLYRFLLMPMPSLAR